MELKKGLRNPLEEAQVRKAVVALQTFLEKQKAGQTKKELVSATEYVSCIITRKTIPPKSSLKPIQIDVPHSLYESDAEMCLVVKDTDKDRIKKALAEDPVAGLAKVMTVKKLRKNFSRFEDKRTLAGAYEMFLADDRILPYLKTPLGTKFFVKKKQPVAVRVSRKDVSNAVRAVFHRTVMHTSAGACTNVKIAHFGLSVEEIVENIIVGMNNCAAHIVKGWHGIQSISIKTNESVALPIYNALSELAKLPPVDSKKVLLKRKLEEVESAKTEEKASAKKQKKNTAAKEKAPEAEKPSKKKKAEAVPVAEPVAKKAKKEEPKKVAKKADKEPKKEAKKAKKEEPKKEAKKEAKKEKESAPKAKKQKKQAK
ncbi:hypothetical protein Poli38472_013685 [Pythium oligandrum]|uniref:Ribosomal protein L1 n=1 Tax=Pythium oligandrum TaxID=41045 RepID=A0A8K1CDF1_PYTOL|nr:hypothetical protein Poli38472_013685 [Pythium oligandrum]|eukprot:TMW61222.1 hypothetical protein Poli38472_013685 [Pythium oligandrum]